MKAIVAGYATKMGTSGVDYWIQKFNKLPDYYITKAYAYSVGWIPTEGNLAEVAPSKMIFGGIFHNDNKHLPEVAGRLWYEADIDYSTGFRNDYRLLWSNDGLNFVTYDHYKTFIEIV